MEIDGGFAIYPKTDCPHISSHVGNFPEGHTMDIPGMCQMCEDDAENWMCCQCFLTFCSRQCGRHMIDHCQREGHQIALSFSDLSFWCYLCDSYIEHDALKRIFTQAHLSKFGTLPGQETGSAEEQRQALKAAFGISTKDPNAKNTGSKAIVVEDPSAFLPVGNITEEDMKNNPILDRVLGTIYGHALGDAVGLATEFCSKYEVKTIFKGKPITFPDFARTMHSWRWKKGDWTDDTDQLILIMDMLNEKKQVDIKDFAAKLLSWCQHGFPELGDKVGLGLGTTTSRVFKCASYLEDPHSAAEQVWEQMGMNAAPNGAVMRTDILGCYDYSNRENVLQNTLDICRVTHFDSRCQASCIAVTLMVRRLIQMSSADITHDTMEKILTDDILPECEKLVDPDYWNDFKKFICASTLEEMELDEAKSIGYTLKCLGAGFWGLRQMDKSFQEIIQAIAAEAGDADTNACVAGGLVGSRIGYRQLPMEWLCYCPHKKWLDEKVERLVTFMGLRSVTTSDGTTSTTTTTSTG
eukprot:TRINITY_DN103223_c0_g1_i1.p1 TRINITY_DN103223_c0_g1~~TRINITY_DN103223_c0_g1_i1.p1  ORF type:complete len:524 (-),score=52.40 TRINITY_DN103223_c0_g1_i1:156-1727(-)